ncbi:DUF4382 domain-containing protein [Flavobacteriaceae bacterium R38]|nr:DUF4382 domain-containing protein [Flavobacteriaceae bacterium R38]
MPLLILILSGCSSDNNDSNDETSRVSIRLVDAPGDFEAVNVEVLDVLINVNNDDDNEEENNEESNSDNGFISIGEDSRIVNLLEFTGGNSLLLADTEVPSGRVNQIRLLLGENNTLVMRGGEEVALSTPSGQQSGLKLQVNEDLEPGITYNFTIDFDVAKSIVVQAGNSGRFNLNPVLRIITEATSGAIEGIVNPSEFQSMITVTVDGEEISTFTDEQGRFFLPGIPAGTYSLLITPDETSGLTEETIENVEVSNGETTDIGTVTLE